MRRGGPDRELHLVVVAYFIVAVITFGHAWNHLAMPYESNVVQRPSAAFLCGWFWPLYWSVQLWDVR